MSFFRILSRLSVVAVSSLVMIGCGGGGGALGTSDTESITGQATKGPCALATANLHVVDILGALSAPIASTTTDADGGYSLIIPAANLNDLLAVTITGGSYNDEATGQTVLLTQELTGFLQSLDGNGNTVLEITPVTTLVLARARTLIQDGANQSRQVPIREALTNAEVQVRQALGIPDGINIFKNRPGNLTAGAVSESVAREYGAIVAGFSQLGKNAGVSADAIIKSIIEDFKDGNLNGRNGSQDVEVADGVKLSDTFNGSNFVAAVQTFIQSDKNKSGSGAVEFKDLIEILDDADGTVSQPPVIQAVVPGEGSNQGGTSVQITGTGFQSGASVKFGTASATNVQVNQAGTLITATTPAGAGKVDITVVNPDELISILAGGFTYLGQAPVDVDQLVADGRTSLRAQDVPLAQSRFSAAIAADPSNQQARLFRGFTNLAGLAQGSLQAGQQQAPAVRGFLTRFGVTVNSLDIYANQSTVFDADEPRTNDELDLADNSPTGEEVRDFILREILPSLCAAIDDLSAIDETFTPLLLSPADLGFGEQGDGLLGGVGTDDHEVDFGDVALTKSALLLLKAKLLILVSYNLDTDIDAAIAAAQNDTLILENSQIGNTFTANDPNGILGKNPNILKLDAQVLVTDNTLGDARQAVLDAVTCYNKASAFIRSEQDDQSNDLIVFPDPEDPANVQSEDLTQESDFRTLIAAYRDSVTGDGTQVPVDLGASTTTTLRLDLFFAGKNIQDFLPTFQHVDGENLAQLSSVAADRTFGGISPDLTQNDLNAALGRVNGNNFTVNGSTVELVTFDAILDAITDDD